MATLQDVVQQVSVDLNDYAPGYEFTTWTEPQLTAYVIEGLQVAYQVRPDLFLDAHVIKLDSGTSIQRPCGCTQVRRIYGVCDSTGRVLYGLRKRKDSDKLKWYGAVCPTDPRHYKAREYSIDSEGDTLYIEPAPPAGQDVFILVECAVAPTSDNIKATTNIEPELVAPIIQWALYRAKMMDSENNSTIFAVAKEHKTTCFALLQTQLTMGKTNSIEVDDTATTTTTNRTASNGLNSSV